MRSAASTSRCCCSAISTQRRTRPRFAPWSSDPGSRRGETLEAHATRIARLWAGFNVIARDNPNAWIRQPYNAEQIARAGPDNPMISYPYTRLMNANARVDMAAGLVVCSLQAARDAGVPDEKIVYLHAATEANDSNFLSLRENFHSSPAMRLAGARALELAGRAIDEIDHVDLYSCFPSAVQVAAAELGLSEDRPLTVTGGLTFGGGPLNSYTLHAVARMVEVLRDDRGSTGLVSGNGGWLAKHAFGIYSSEPPDRRFPLREPPGEGRRTFRCARRWSNGTGRSRSRPTPWPIRRASREWPTWPASPTTESEPGRSSTRPRHSRP